MMNNPFLYRLIIFAIASSGGWIFTYIGISGILETLKRKSRETSRARGRVVEHIRYQGRRRRRGRSYDYTYWRSLVEFTAWGRQYRLEGVVRDGKPAVGETVEIEYDPDDPSHFHYPGQLEGDMRFDGITLVAGALWLVLAFFLTMRAL